MAADRNPIEVAIKLLKDVSPKAKEMLFSEAFAMRDLVHKNIGRLYGVISSGEPYAMITELMKDGSLKNYLQQRRLNLEPALPDAELVDISTQVCRGMAYVESKGVVHRDLAARNILINILSTKPIKVEAKISDFGLAKVLHEKGVYVMARDTPMPRQWMAPEAFNKNQFTTKSDIWAYGATLCEIFSEGDDPSKPRTRISFCDTSNVVPDRKCRPPCADWVWSPCSDSAHERIAVRAGSHPVRWRRCRLIKLIDRSDCARLVYCAE